MKAVLPFGIRNKYFLCMVADIGYTCAECQFAQAINDFARKTHSDEILDSTNRRNYEHTCEKKVVIPFDPEKRRFDYMRLERS